MGKQTAQAHAPIGAAWNAHIIGTFGDSYVSSTTSWKIERPEQRSTCEEGSTFCHRSQHTKDASTCTILRNIFVRGCAKRPQESSDLLPIEWRARRWNMGSCQRLSRTIAAPLDMCRPGWMPLSVACPDPTWRVFPVSRKTGQDHHPQRNEVTRAE
jgi:hypothetical protein